MTNGERKMLWCGVSAGTIMGLAIGGMIALVIAMKPEFIAGLIK
jgi:tetrahydromethanopterin S-methyltransferase subunit F